MRFVLLRRTAVAAATTLALLGLAAPPSHAVTTLTLVPSMDPTYPQQVPASSGETTPVRFTVTSSEATTVTATASGPGLEVGPAQSLGTVSGAKGFSVDVRGLDPGFHELKVTVAAQDGAAPVSVTLPLVWTSGSPMVVQPGDLAGRAYGWEGFSTLAGTSTRAVDLLVFLKRGLAFRGLPPRGRPTCKAAGPTAGGECLPYSYDPASGLVQVGSGIIGRVVGEGLYTSGFARADTDDGELFASYLATDPLSFAKRHTALTGSWSYESKDDPSGIVKERVRFHRHHGYRLSWTEDGKTRTLTGGWSVNGRGKITFRAKGKVRQVGTLLLGGAKVGKGKPVKHGLWLVLGGRKGTLGDGNLLTRGK